MARFNLFKRIRGRSLLLISLVSVVVLSACTIQGQTTGLQVLQTVVATLEPTSVPAPKPTPAPESPTDSMPTAEESEQMMVVARALIDSLPQPIPAPEGWTIQPCEGMAPVLCIQTEEGMGASELSAFPLRTLPDFQRALADQGLAFGTIDVESQAYQAGAQLALEEMVENYLEIFAEDRQITYPHLRFVPLEVEPIQFGELPGLHYGFLLQDEGGTVAERVLAYSAFDDNYYYVITAVYDPAAYWSLPSDEALLSFEPYLRQIVSQFELPRTDAAD